MIRSDSPRSRKAILAFYMWWCKINLFLLLNGEVFCVCTFNFVMDMDCPDIKSMEPYLLDAPDT